MPSPPRFAVVGHPNKGKSSIVATLAQDDSVNISPIPGTTVDSREFPMRVDDEILYVLFDTPGFQRARRALAWMQSQSKTAADRPDVVRAFIAAHSDSDQFHDECQLLAPIMQGAGILYVVDGSRPYGVEYEAEMEILRWTGQPSMALINMIGTSDHTEEWKNALGQYFRIVRIFNAMTAEFNKRLELLTDFGALKDEWRAPLSRAVARLTADRDERRLDSSHMIAGMIADMIGHVETRKIGRDDDPEQYKEKLLSRYESSLRDIEKRGRRSVEMLYDYDGLQRDEKDLDIDGQDLFAQDTWLLWGLNQRQMLTTGTLGGAAAGAGVDLASGGTSLMLGALIGGVVGGASAWFTADRLTKIEILGLPLGGNELRAGPLKSINLPYVVLARALHHHQLVRSRTHAHRSVMALNDEAPAHKLTADQLPTATRKQLEGCFARLRKNTLSTANSVIDELAGEVNQLMQSPLADEAPAEFPDHRE